MTGKKDTVLPKIVVPRVTSVSTGNGDTDHCVVAIEVTVLTRDEQLARVAADQLVEHIRAGRVGISPGAAVPAGPEPRGHVKGWGGG